MRLQLLDYYRGPLGQPGDVVYLPEDEGRLLLDTAVSADGEPLSDKELNETDAAGTPVHPGYPQAMWLPTDDEVRAEKVAVAERKAAARGR